MESHNAVQASLAIYSLLIFVNSLHKILDGVGPVYNRPSTDQLPHLVYKEEEQILSDMWQVTHYSWHIKCDMWHMTHNRCGEVPRLTKFQLPSFYGLGVKVFWRYYNKEWLTDSPGYTESVNNVHKIQPTGDTESLDLFGFYQKKKKKKK